MNPVAPSRAPRLPRTGRPAITDEDRSRSVSFGALLAADWHRIQHTWMLPLTVIGPAGVTLLGVVLFLLRGEWLLSGFDPARHSGIDLVLSQLGLIEVFALCLGTTLLASMIVDVEHRSDTWKAFFALPVGRWKAYLAKFTWVAVLLAVASLLMALGYAVIVYWQGIGPVAWDTLGGVIALPWIGTLPLLAFQLFVSTALKNQALPLALGIITPMFGMGLSGLPAWLPWRLPGEALDVAAAAGAASLGSNVTTSLSATGIVVAALCGVAVMLAAGITTLNRKEIV